MGLIVHCGGRRVSLKEVKAVATPGPTSSHFPIPHYDLLKLAANNLRSSGFEIVAAEYALRNGRDIFGRTIPGAQFFGLLQLKNGNEHPEYSLIAGIRNAHDKACSASMALGSRVFVCDNMAFSGEVKFGRKHTKHINRDLPHLVYEAMGRLGILRNNQDKRIEAYKEKQITDNQARAAIMLAAESGYMSWSKTGKVWDEWKTPRHKEFSPRNAWSLFNAKTQVLKSYCVQDLSKRTQGIHQQYDLLCNVQFN